MGLGVRLTDRGGSAKPCLAGQGWDEGVRLGGQGVEEVPALLAGGRDDRAEGGEVGRAFEGAKGARGFPRHVLPQKDLGLVLRDAFAPVLDDLKLGATPAIESKA